RHVVARAWVSDGHANESADGIEDGGSLGSAAVAVHGGEHDCRSVHVDEAPRVVDGDTVDGAADGVEPDAAALVGGGVAGGDGAGVDVDDARAIGVDATARVARVVVADRAVVDRERPESASRGVLHGDTAAIAAGGVAGNDHVGER